MQNQKKYDVVIIGAGASGSALAYTISKYTNIKRVAILEKYDKPGQVNSRTSNNSQTLHVGDIETNYTVEKVKQVYPAAMMVVHYGEMLTPSERNKFLFPTSKMVLAVGKDEVATLEKRFDDLRPIFPNLKKLHRDEIAQVEPAVVLGRDEKIPILALHTTSGYAVDFETLSQSLITNSKINNPDIDVLFSHEVSKISKLKNNQGYHLELKNGASIETRILVVNADSYSLFLAHQVDYGKEFSLIPIAGSFYFSKKILNGKVYTAQEPKLPFAAVHGDPDIHKSGATRWGPTARFHPVLEARNMKTSIDFFKSSGLWKWKTWASFAKILFDPIRFKYLLENMLYEFPWIGTQMFIKNVRKIVPNMKASDVTYAKGYGGMRLQRVDTTTKELLLGEGKIIGDMAIFNMTPSPGASVCLYNAMRDAETVTKFLGTGFHFDKERMMTDLYKESETCEGKDPGLKYNYVS